MASRSLTDLDPEVSPAAQAFFVECGKQKIDVICTCTYRSPEEQGALFAQGRQPLGAVNRLRIAVGIAPITAKENQNRVTNAMPNYSWHQWRRAFDVVPLEGGKCIWSPAHPIWKQVGIIGKRLGLEWAGNWPKAMREYPHFQKVGNLTIEYMLTGKAPEILIKV